MIMITLFPFVRPIFLILLIKKRTSEANDNGTKNVEKMVPLKYLSKFCLSKFLRTFEIPLVNFENNLILTWSASYVVDFSQQIMIYFPLLSQTKVQHLQQVMPTVMFQL